MQIAERRPRLGPVRVQRLRRDELLRCAVELVAVGSRQSIIWRAGKQRYRTQTHAADRIGERRRDKRPELIRRHAVEHVERGDAHHRVWILKPFPRQADIRRRDVRREPGERARTGEGRSVGVRRDRGKQHGRARLIVPCRMEGFAVSLQALPLRPEPARRSPRPPRKQACPCGNRCRRCSSEACRTDRAVERGSCDRAACRPP